MSSAATMLRRAYADAHREALSPASEPEPCIPWFIHAFRPGLAPATPDWSIVDSSASPVMWPTQCRDCWGFVDDPRHLTPLPLGPLE